MDRQWAVGIIIVVDDGSAQSHGTLCTFTVTVGPVTDDAAVGYYRWLNFNSPMTDQTADNLVDQLTVADPAHILDVGCGWAELLLRLLAACPDATGHGIDHDEVLIERAKGNAADRDLSSRVTFSAELGQVEPADLVLNIGAEHVFGTLDQALVELRQLVRPGGRLLFGTQFWEKPPHAALISAIGELPTLRELVDAAAVGFRPLGLKVASPEDWDHFEFGFLADWEQLVMTSSSEKANKARRAADEHRNGYLQRRGILGFAFLTLGRPAESLGAGPG